MNRFSEARLDDFSHTQLEGQRQFVACKPNKSREKWSKEKIAYPMLFIYFPTCHPFR